MEKVNPFIKLVDINKIYDGGFHAVHDFNIDINKHEFIVFVGPSGCGKSTTIRMIAGLEDISSGEFYINNVLSNTTLSKDRDIAMVFQNYALYPNLTVYDNMAFSLQLRKFPKDEIDKRVKEAAKILQLTDYLQRKPKNLSGGQRQRVALGRAIVRNAQIFLMDEPLSNLDAKLRVQMRSEIIRIHKSVGATTIYVTHDQTEAMTMADRIVVMKDGYIQQIGKPREIYKHPLNKFVASFIGSPSMNFLDVVYKDNKITFSNGVSLSLEKEFAQNHKKHFKGILEELKKNLEEIKNEPEPVIKRSLFRKKKESKIKNDKIERISELERKIEEVNDILKGKEHTLTLGIRPESVTLYDKKNKNSIDVKIELSELLGDEYYAHFNFATTDMLIKISSEKEIRAGDEINIGFELKNIYLFDKIKEKTIY